MISCNFASVSKWHTSILKLILAQCASSRAQPRLAATKIDQCNWILPAATDDRTDLSQKVMHSVVNDTFYLK